MKEKSHWLYIHKELSGKQDVWKVGVAITPHSAVRLRQRFLWDPFTLEHLYFGHSDHIDFLEKTIKHELRHLSGNKISNLGQTELFQIELDKLVGTINSIIRKYNLQVRDEWIQYTAHKSEICPLGIPSEKYAKDYCESLANTTFGNVNMIHGNGLFVFDSYEDADINDRLNILEILEA